MRRAALASVCVVLAGLAPACRRASTTAAPPLLPEPNAALTFVHQGARATLSARQLLAQVAIERFTAFDPYYQRQKSWRAFPLARVLALGFPGVALDGEQLLVRARDGYTVPFMGSQLLDAGAYLAVADDAVPGWEPIGPQRAQPGPFYLVWRRPDQQDLATHPRPWQLDSIEIARFEAVFPHAIPSGETPGSAAMRGFAHFRSECIFCHAINREGGRIGPDLNVPQSIVEYRPLDQIRAYIRDPRQFRYGAMPAHPQLSNADLDDLIAYFQAMKRRKHDAERGIQ